MKRKWIVLLCMAWLCAPVVSAAGLWVEAERFAGKGGWVVDQQFMDVMGSPYLMAHGMGEPVADASTRVVFPETGVYYVYARTYNWTAPWQQAAGPGKFRLGIDGKLLSTVLGDKGSEWMWQEAGKVTVKKCEVMLTLHDLTGFNGRCDAIYFTTEHATPPPSDMRELTAFRRKMMQLPDVPETAGTYDFVVVGGGIAGISAAVAAARLGCKVALINDRPVLGGNNSSEIRVHLGGRIEIGPYRELGGLQKEFGHTREGNAKPAEFYEDDRKAAIVANEKNITLFSNYHVMGVEMDEQQIRAVIAAHIENGMEKRFVAPLFADCTGDATVGCLAGADYRTGREGRDEFGEATAPEQADKMTMGASVQWYSENSGKPAAFPSFSHGVEFNERNCERVTMGEWTWETGMNLDQINDFERIRDYGLMVVYSNWSYLKNRFSGKDQYLTRKLGWVAYVSGKRESRRLMGDYILKEDDLRKYVTHEDGTAATTWTIDLHYPDPKNTENFPGAEFKSIARHISIYPYPVPYRCLYSRNVDNLFMAGRNISMTHVALGTVRVMRTAGMLGEVVGMAATLCRRHNEEPRGIYRRHLDELKALMREGVGKKGLPNNQKFNEGGTLSRPPEVK